MPLVAVASMLSASKGVGWSFWEYPSWQLVKTLPNFPTQYNIIFDDEAFSKGPIIHKGADDRHLIIWFFNEEESKRKVVLYDWLAEQELASRKPTYLETCPILYQDFHYLADTQLGCVLVIASARR